MKAPMTDYFNMAKEGSKLPVLPMNVAKPPLRHQVFGKLKRSHYYKNMKEKQKERLK